MAREAVKVNVYDMTTLNTYMGTLGIGIYHCGLQIYNRGRQIGRHTSNAVFEWPLKLLEFGF